MSVNVYDPINDELIPVAGATLFAEMPLGAIQAFDSTDIPSNFLEFKGQTVNRADYPDLWAHIVKNSLFGEGKFYGIGDGSTTFTLADLRETSLKGYGETSRSVGAHVKSGGLGIGEFIDDQVQTHKHGMWFNRPSSGNYAGITDVAGGTHLDYGDSQTGRSGATTEVKAVGVVWAVKAKMTGLPIDLKAEVEKMMNEKIECGESNVTGGSAVISFTNTHSTAPKTVVATALENTTSTRIAWIKEKTKDNFTVQITNASETGATCKVEWIAMW